MCLWLSTQIFHAVNSRSVDIIWLHLFTDPPGTPGDGSIVNDLDLVVIVTPFTGLLPSGPHSLKDALSVRLKLNLVGVAFASTNEQRT